MGRLFHPSIFHVCIWGLSLEATSPLLFDASLSDTQLFPRFHIESIMKREYTISLLYCKKHSAKAIYDAEYVVIGGIDAAGTVSSRWHCSLICSKLPDDAVNTARIH